MAFETRNGMGKYYTRSTWRDGRVHREYVGTGEVARLAAQIDSLERDMKKRARQAEREAEEKSKANIQAIEAPLDTIDYICQIAMSAALEQAGYHRPKRWKWRKRRV